MLRAHTALAWAVVSTNGVAGAWALAAARVERFRHVALWWFIAIAEASIAIQVALGVYLVSAEGLTAPEFHMFYGFVALFAVTLLYGYRVQLRHRLHLLYGFGSLFLMGLGIRAMLLG